MPILMMLYCLLGFGEVTPLTQEEMITKANVERAYTVEQHLNSRGCGETFLHSRPQSFNADREIERNS